jgi:hypothetical protein
MSPQSLLFCRCGRDRPTIAGLCRRCYGARARSRQRFAGGREAVLARDGARCRGCGGREWLSVHHRRPGEHAPEWLITVCAACHARVHRLAAVRRWLPEALLPLWAEQHPQTPLQLQLPLEAAR